MPLVRPICAFSWTVLWCYAVFRLGALGVMPGGETVASGTRLSGAELTASLRRQANHEASQKPYLLASSKFCNSFAWVLDVPSKVTHSMIRPGTC